MRRSLRISAWIAGGAVLLVGLLIGAILLLGNTDAGRRAIEKLTARLTDGQVDIIGLEGSFPSRLVVAELQLRDARGVWLTANRIVLDWTPLAYLRGRLQVDNLRVAKIDMERLPQSASTSNRDPVIPRIDVSAASIELLQLGAELAGAPASLAAHGSAHLRTVRDMLFDASARRIDGDGSYELHLKFDPLRMDAALQLHEPASGPLENILNLPGLGALSASLTLHGPRSAEQLALSLQAGGLKGQAQGSLNLIDLSADFDFDFQSAAMNPRADLAWNRAALQGRWHGSIKTPSANGHLDASGVRLPGDLQIAALNAELSADSGKADLKAWVTGLRIPGPQPKLLEDSPVKMDATLRLDEPSRRLDLTAAHKLFSLRAQAITSGAQSATLELRLPDVTPLAALAGQAIRGSARVNAQLDGYPAAPHVNLDAAADLIPGKEIWSAAVGERASFEASATYKDQSLYLDNAKLSGRSLAVSANGNVSSSSIKGRWELSLADLSAWSTALAGTLKASGSIDGPKAALSAQAAVTSTVAVRGSPRGNLSADVKVSGFPSATAGTLTASGSFDGAPLQLDISAEHTAKESIRAIIRHANWKSAHAEGDITIATATSQSRGHLKIADGNLEDLQNLFGMALGGSVTADIALEPEAQRTRMQLDFDAKNVALNLLKADAHISGSGFTDSFVYQANLQIPKLRGAAATLASKGNLNLDGRELRIASAELSYRGQEARLLSPARMEFKDGLSVDSLKIGAQKAQLVVEGRLAPELNVKATVSNVEPALVNVLAPNLLLAGEIGAHAELHGTFSSLTGEVGLDATGLRMADDAALGIPPADLHIDAHLHEDTAELSARINAGPGSKLSAVGKVPIAFDGAVDLKINGNVEIGLISPLLEARGLRATGQLEFDTVVTGSVAEPQIGGSVELTQATLRDYRRGISLSDIQAQIVGNQAALEIKSFTASAAPGRLSMVGTVGILQAGIPVELKITARNAQPIASKLVTANLNADLRISGTVRERLDLSGSVLLNRTLIGIPNSLPPNVAVLDVRRRGKAAALIPEKPLVIGLDVNVQAQQQLLVQGRGLDAEMGGELHITGTTDAPIVSGGFDLQRGNFSLGGSRLNFTAGRVAFDGTGLTNRIDPTLDFTAQTNITSDTTATMRIRGYADAPTFEFSSNPAQPPDEIMALLLFGVPATQLSPLQLAQIGVALASLSGVGGDGGLNPLVKIQKSLGLDRLNLGAATTTATATGVENSGASIAAGRYIYKRVYIEAKQSTTGSSQVGANVDLTKHLKLQTRLGNGTASVQGTTPENDPGSSIGLFYQFEY
jgi:translocation and assembly module TamB